MLKDNSLDKAEPANPTILEQYRHISLVGEGYFSIVKRCQHLESGEEYAIKELKKEFINNKDYVHRFSREIDLLQILRGHENIIDLIDYQTNGDRQFYIMPLATTNLYKYIKNNNTRLQAVDRIQIFDQVLAAIKFSHSKAILHRDIYPNNILLFESNGEYIVKVSDFGLGKNLESLSAFTKSKISQYGHVYYVAPAIMKRGFSTPDENGIKLH